MKTMIQRLVAGALAAVSLLAIMLAGSSSADATVTFGGYWGQTTVECYTDLHKAYFTIDMNGPSTIGAALTTERWNGANWVTVPGSVQVMGEWTLYRGWWGGVSTSGYYRHTIQYQWRDSNGTMWKGKEILTSYRQMVKTRYGNYLATSASYCTV
jgi:hypothetical protein